MGGYAAHMGKVTAATLLMIFTQPDGSTGTLTFAQPSVEQCEKVAAGMLANPKHKNAKYTVRHECLPHYRMAPSP